MVVELTELLRKILENPAETLALIRGLKKAGKLTATQLKKIAQAYKKLQQSKRFGFTPPNEDIAIKLLEIDKSPLFQRIRELIGKHPDLRLIRISLLIEKLNTEGATLLVDQIRSEIYENHGEYGIKIINLGSTGRISFIIDSLEKIKEEYQKSTEELINDYQYMIKKADYITVYVNNEDYIPNIELKICKKMDQRPDIFFVIAAGRASDASMQVIAKLNNKGIIRDKGYLFFSPLIKPHGEERQRYLWTFNRFL